MTHNNLKNFNVVILCGGLGTRLKEICNDRPKPMIGLGNEPFLNLIIESFWKYGCKRFILCVGHLANFIKEYYKNSKYAPYVFFSEEKNGLLGTGGAIKNAESLIQSDNFFVTNGDSFCDTDLISFTNNHLIGERLVSMVLASPLDRDDAGDVVLDKDSLKIINYQEKQAINSDKKYISAGIYLFNKKILNLIPEKEKFSLEYSLFPKIVGEDFYGFISENKVFDIGTPERYNESLEYFRHNNYLN